MKMRKNSKFCLSVGTCIHVSAFVQPVYTVCSFIMHYCKLHTILVKLYWFDLPWENMNIENFGRKQKWNCTHADQIQSDSIFQLINYHPAISIPSSVSRLCSQVILGVVRGEQKQLLKKMIWRQRGIIIVQYPLF